MLRSSTKRDRVAQIMRWTKLNVGWLLLLFPLVSNAQMAASSTMAEQDTWVATDELGRSLSASTPNPDSKKFVGVFYFVWQGSHGYDKHTKPLPDHAVMPKEDKQYKSPYDLTQIVKANPKSPKFGPDKAFHHWGEPLLGYYLADDDWVIRKHAQMLSDAGVDVIMIDATNAAIYLPTVNKIAKIYRELRADGRATPDIAFLLNSRAGTTAQTLFDSVYKTNQFSDLWFYWKGKPLLLAPSENLSDEVKSFFTLRQSWAWSRPNGWFGKGQQRGKDKWPWLDYTPQAFGWHESAEQPEQISVAVAQHPTSNIGRSHQNGVQPEPDQFKTNQGIYFNEQWQRALDVSPEFLFITGWNEWVAMRFTDDRAGKFLGKKRSKGDSYFVDLYNAEYSRDVEMMKDGYGDNYYFQMVDGIRQFRGLQPLPNRSSTIAQNVKIDGEFQDWQQQGSVYVDDINDVTHRDHPGWGRFTRYTNKTGRNDIVESRVMSDNEYLYFYVKTAQPLSLQRDGEWMNLLLVNSDTQASNIFDLRVEFQSQSNKAILFSKQSGQVSEVEVAVGKNELELKLSKALLSQQGLQPSFDFKWSDNTFYLQNKMNFWLNGDTAPNGRFYYRY